MVDVSISIESLTVTIRSDYNKKGGQGADDVYATPAAESWLSRVEGF